MTTIYLIRHAEAEGNLYRRIHGWYNSLITENGFAQIAALEERFRDIPVDAVYSSDLYRTKTTARAVYVPKGLELHTHPGLREMNLGDWEDMTFGFVRHNWPEELARFNATDPDWAAPNGEGFYQLGDRMERAVREIALAHPGQTVALFSHGTAIRQFLARAGRIPPEEWGGQPHSENTAVTCLAFNGEDFSLVYQSDSSHVPEELATLGKQQWWRKSGKAEDVNLWYSPLDPARDWDLYLEARREAWVTTHGPDVPFDGDGFLGHAKKKSLPYPLGGDPGLRRGGAGRRAGAGPLPLCRGQRRVHPLLLHCPGAAGTESGDPAHRPGGVGLPAHGPGQAAPAVRPLQ